MDTNAAIQEAIQKTNSGDLKSAQLILANVLREEPRNARAWYLLSQIVGDRNREIDCLKKVLEIEPNSQQAQARLQTLQQNTFPAQPGPVVLEHQPIGKKKKTPSLLTCLIGVLLAIGIFSAGLFFYIKNAPDATQCVQVDHNICLVNTNGLNSDLYGSIINTCDKPVKDIDLHGSVVNPRDSSSVFGEVSATQKITLGPGETAQFDLVALNTYYSENLACIVDVRSAYFVK